MKVVLWCQNQDALRRFGCPQLLRTWRGENHLCVRAAYSAMQQKSHLEGLVVDLLVPSHHDETAEAIQPLLHEHPLPNAMDQIVVSVPQTMV